MTERAVICTGRHDCSAAQHIHGCYGEKGVRYLIGYRCKKNPEGGLIPPRAFIDPCGSDEAVWSDGSVTDA